LLEQGWRLDDNRHYRRHLEMRRELFRAAFAKGDVGTSPGEPHPGR
jgi:hypothetical protein